MQSENTCFYLKKNELIDICCWVKMYYTEATEGKFRTKIDNMAINKIKIKGKQNKANFFAIRTSDIVVFWSVIRYNLDT